MSEEAIPMDSKPSHLMEELLVCRSTVDEPTQSIWVSIQTMSFELEDGLQHQTFLPSICEEI